MNPAGLTNAGLKKLHDAIVEALAEDDQIPAGESKPYMVRELPSWREFADAIESEMSARDMAYSKIQW